MVVFVAPPGPQIDKIPLRHSTLGPEKFSPRCRFIAPKKGGRRPMVFFGFSMISSNHGNPQFPSFLGVITHILGVLNLHVSWALGVQWNEQMRSLKTSLCFFLLFAGCSINKCQVRKRWNLGGFFQFCHSSGHHQPS